jgi:hypothetical protein
MVCLLEQGQPCFQKTPKSHKNLQGGLDQLNNEKIQDEYN